MKTKYLFIILLCFFEICFAKENALNPPCNMIYKVYRNNKQLLLVSRDCGKTFHKISSKEVLQNKIILWKKSDGNWISNDGGETWQLLSNLNIETDVNKNFNTKFGGVSDKVLIVFSNENVSGMIEIYNSLGQCIFKGNYEFYPGKNEISIPFLNHIGPYYVIIRFNNELLKFLYPF